MSKFIPSQKISTKLSLLNTYHNSILNEYRENFERLEFKDFTEEQNNFIHREGRGYPIGYDSYAAANPRVEGVSGWHIAPLFAEDNIYYSNAVHLPKLCTVLQQIGMTTVCAINVLDPGQSLDWHIDKDYIPGVPLLRIMWGMDCGDQKSLIQLQNDDGSIEERRFHNGKFYIFRPETKHRVENLGNTSRSVVCIDYIADTKYRRESIL